MEPRLHQRSVLALGMAPRARFAVLLQTVCWPLGPSLCILLVWFLDHA